MGAALLFNFLRFLLIGLWLVILARVILSWIDPAGRSRFAVFIIQTSEPILAPIRRALPRTGMLDLSPLVVLIVLGADAVRRLTTRRVAQVVAGARESRV